MCGITGIYTFNARSKDKIGAVRAATAQLKFRGPDNDGIFIGDTCALGHRRLSIIDTSKSASQPMRDVTGRYIIVFNGEIFNYKELKAKYFPGHAAERSHSDTEVLLQLLIKYGTECLSWLSGFFALAFFDVEKKQMLLARDRFGKKPLLYYKHEDYFVFASELKALLAYDIPKELNYTALHQYLQLNYVPQPQSMIKGVVKLMPGCFLKIDANGGLTEGVYYKLQIHAENYAALSYEAAQRKLVELMGTSVNERMISDVPLGAFLSGGIDSSVVVAVASKYTSKLSTFSVGYKDNAYFDETKYALLVAKKYNTDHTVFSLSNDDFLQHLDGVLNYLDEPFADSSALPVYILSKLTRQQVTVALSGDGGDEVFAGYNKHAAEHRVRQRSIVNSIVRSAEPLLRILPKGRNNKITDKVRQLHRFAKGARLSNADRYWQWASFNTSSEADEMLTRSALGGIGEKEEMDFKSQLLAGLHSDDYNEVLLADMNLVLLSDMLVKVDMMSMANSLEVRSPFLDYKIVDFAFGLPSSYKIDGTMKKRIVQDAFRSMLPGEIYNRPKQGFDVPLSSWFKNELSSFIFEDLLSEKFVKAQDIFDFEAVKRLKQKLYSVDPGDSVEKVWGLIVFQSWYKRYFDNAAG
jgi:asparagine synthase (glutamine-hydrolysing)